MAHETAQFSTITDTVTGARACSISTYLCLLETLQGVGLLKVLAK
ncbi:hypothetical protein [Arthrobacter sp. DR-2P]|nr:hypothetical protein [Arthrobacter sp. DR-2P]